MVKSKDYSSSKPEIMSGPVLTGINSAQPIMDPQGNVPSVLMRDSVPNGQLLAHQSVMTGSSLAAVVNPQIPKLSDTPRGIHSGGRIVTQAVGGLVTQNRPSKSLTLQEALMTLSPGALRKYIQNYDFSSSKQMMKY